MKKHTYRIIFNIPEQKKFGHYVDLIATDRNAAKKQWEENHKSNAEFVEVISWSYLPNVE